MAAADSTGFAPLVSEKALVEKLELVKTQ